MICVSVLYPNTAGKKFDHDYFAQKHMPLVFGKSKDLGMIRYEFDTGIAGGAPGAPAPFVTVARLYLDDMEAFQRIMGAHGAEFMGDIPNYTDIEPQFQVSSVTAS